MSSRAALFLVALLATLAAGCGGSTQASEPTEVVLVTHDSFAVSKPVKAAFERETGLKLRILETGDAGIALNRALLTKGNPEGDVFFGLDNNLLTRALDEGLFEPYAPAALARVPDSYELDPEHRAVPVDHGEVCLNADKGWFAEHGIEPPRSLDELTDARYRGLLVVESPATSTPGLAFLLATVARYGEPGWQGYWRKLRANDVRVVDGWEQAYTVQFSGAGGSKGKRPIVVSYASSPPAEVIFASEPLAAAPTAVIEDSCFRQIELAGILKGAKNESGARKLIDFLLSARFQADVPLQMFVFPVRTGVELPEAFRKFAVVPERPLELDPALIGKNRDRWVREWTSVVLR